MANNDIGIIIGILGIMIFLAFFMPYFQTSFNQKTVSYNIDGIENSISAELSDPVNTGITQSVTAWNIVGSLLTMFFWTYTFLPIWLQLVFFLMRIALVLLLIKYIPFIGSGS